MKGKTVYLSAEELEWVRECVFEWSNVCENCVSDIYKNDLKLTDKLLAKLY